LIVDDKSIERQRYESRARLALESQPRHDPLELGAAGISSALRAPYDFYEQLILELVSSKHEVLELAAGSGFHTAALLRTGARVTASDISPSSLALLEKNLGSLAPGRLKCRVADIESLPFETQTFDIVACAGSLSYGDPELVNAEILRVLRPGGAFICVDSLNHNPIYRFNRWLNYRRGERTSSTLHRIPDLQRIEELSGHFSSVRVRYFGSITWAMPVLEKLLGRASASRLSDAFDDFIAVKRSAFKFVLAAQGRR
jgi:SAM-dependent methyltransferase